MEMKEKKVETKFKMDDVVVVTVNNPSGCNDSKTLGDIGMITEVCTDDGVYYQVHTGDSGFYYSDAELRMATPNEVRILLKKLISSCRKF